MPPIFPSNSAYTQGFTRKIAFKFMGDYPLLGKRFQSDFLRDVEAKSLDFLITTGKAPYLAKRSKEFVPLVLRQLTFLPMTHGTRFIRVVGFIDLWRPMTSQPHRELKTYSYM